MKTKIKIIILLAFAILFSCSEEWLDTKPKGSASIDNFYNKEGVEDLLIGAYSNITGHNGRTGEGWASSVSNWVWGSVCSDDAYKGSNPGDQSQINHLEGFTVDAANSYVNDHWRMYFDGVVRTNDVLVANKFANDMTDNEKKLVEAQAKFLRAHYYFELTLVHGPVPFIDENTEKPESISNDHILWMEIEDDLKFAIENLPIKWSDKGRPTQWAAKTFLGKVYLFQKKYVEAKALLEDVYRNGGFSLVDDYVHNYLVAKNNNQESIFEIQFAVNDGYTANANSADGINGPHFMGSSGFFQPSHSLVSAHRVNDSGLPLLDDIYTADDILPYSITGDKVLYTGFIDPRLDIGIGRPGVPIFDWGIHKGNSWVRNPNNGGPYINKKQMFLKSEKGTANSLSGRIFFNANNYRKYKLSHVILWLAECETEIGSLSEATRLVNLIRNRAKNSEVVRFDDGTPAANYLIEPYPEDFSSKDYARKAIQMEMRIEFSMEGMRFFDLVRWGIIDSVLNNYLGVEATRMGYLEGKHFTKGQHEIWPIPQVQIDITNRVDKILIQNPGY